MVLHHSPDSSCPAHTLFESSESIFSRSSFDLNTGRDKPQWMAASRIDKVAAAENIRQGVLGMPKRINIT